MTVLRSCAKFWLYSRSIGIPSKMSMLQLPALHYGVSSRISESRFEGFDCGQGFRVQESTRVLDFGALLGFHIHTCMHACTHKCIHI